MRVDTPAILGAVLIPCILLCRAAPGAAYSLKNAKEDIAQLRFEEAREKLPALAGKAAGTEKQEILLILARLERSSLGAETAFREVLAIDPASRPAKEAALELAKIKFAAGNYHEALSILHDSGACETLEEACYFEGLSAKMAKDYRTARDAFSRASRGAYRVWSELSTAEIHMEENNVEAACNQYRSLAAAMINPVAMYRFGECLERLGEKDDAAETFESIIDRFKSTPEAVLAAEKLKILTSAPAPAPAAQETPASASQEEGYTIQFGSFHDRHNAVQLAERVKKTLRGVRIDTDLVDYREIHRVRYGFFRTREEAQRRAGELKAAFGNELTIMKIP